MNPIKHLFCLMPLCLIPTAGLTGEGMKHSFIPSETVREVPPHICGK